MGDYILTENDIREQRAFLDAVATNRGHFCQHFSGTQYDFRLGDWKWIAVKPDSVPFRGLCSRNVENLMMASKAAKSGGNLVTPPKAAERDGSEAGDVTP